MTDKKYMGHAGYAIFKAEQPDGTSVDLAKFMRSHPELLFDEPMQAPQLSWVTPSPPPPPPPGKSHKIFSQSPGPKKIQVGDVWLAAYDSAPGKHYHFHIVAYVTSVDFIHSPKNYWLGVKDFPIERDSFTHVSWFDDRGISLDQYGEFRLYRKSRTEHPYGYWLRFHS